MTSRPVVGTRLGHYEVLAPLGAGGMGEVYRARDTRLGRDVAVKLLPPRVAHDAERRARFEREARTISSLNHPHICTLFDVGEEEGGAHYLVMELLEGESLAERLQRGALPLEQVVKYGAQVADALDCAHRQGIVHRDLKPGNVMLTKAGAKLLDFGLARSSGEGSLAAGPEEEATEAKPLTAAGTVLGTYQYMAPEQLAGLEASPRTDIFALGAVLYEMATGKRAFEGKSKTSLVAAILSSQPAPISTVAVVPPALEHVVRKCLEKEPEDRWQSAKDVASELRWIGEAGSGAGMPATAGFRRRTRERLAWALAALATVTALVFAGGAIVAVRAQRDTRLLAFEVNPPEGASFDIRTDAIGMLALSPDGRGLAFTATAGKRSRLNVRSLDAPTAREVPGTEGAQYAFWSPDSRQLGFFAAGKLQKVDVAGGGGAPVVLCSAPDGKGGSWSPNGVIVFAPDAGLGLSRVSDQGGEPQPLTKLDASRKENSHRHPRFLPDGRRFLFLARLDGTAERAVMVGSLDGGPPRELLRSAGTAEFASGHLLYLKGLGGAHRLATATLVAQPFDVGSLALRGEAFPLAEDVTLVEGHAYVEPTSAALGAFSASATGTVAYHRTLGATTVRRLVWRDTEGREIGSLPQEGEYRHVRISPRGDLALLMIEARLAGGSTATGSFVDDHTASDLYILDLERNVSSRLTLGPRGGALGVWAPDGQSVIFSCDLDGHFDLCRQRLSESEPEVLLRSKIDKFPSVISPDGRTLGFGTSGRRGENADAWLLPLEGSREARSWLKTSFDESLDAISPDGRFAAYTSSESGRIEVYVTSFPRPGKKWRVSMEGGIAADWQSDGRRLYYCGGDEFRTVFAVDIDTRGGEVRLGSPKPLFSTAHRGAQLFAPAPDSRRILSIEPVSAAPARDVITVVVNWPERGARATGGAR